MADSGASPEDVVAETILLIEESATLRYVLERLLRGGGHRVELAASYGAGLQRILDGSPGPRLAVVGWPAQTDPAADELFTCLEQEPHSELPVLIMTQEAEPATRTWAARRPHTAMLEWRNHPESLDAIKKLRSSPRQATGLDASFTTRRTPIRVLFVDDSPSIRVYYRRLLTTQGYHTDTASNVAEAFKRAKQEKYDVAIIDYFMPDANGDVLCRMLAEDPQTNTIASAIFTSTYLDQVIKDSLDAGAVECMFKNEADALFLARIAAMGRAIEIKNSIDAERQRLQSILYSVGDGVYGVDTSGVITFVNPAARQILGYDHDSQLLGESPLNLFHRTGPEGKLLPPDVNRLQQSYGSRQELRAWETVFWHRSGKPIPVECTAYPLYVRGQHEGCVVAFRDVSERRSLEEKLRWQATHDPLTELLNRRYFEEQLEKEVSRLQRSDETSALLYLDLDRFKYLNDTAGHAAGDQLLVQVGQKLRRRLRRTDILARLGGDEFAVIMRNVDTDDIQRAADSFRAILQDEEFFCNGKAYKISASAGVATFARGAASPGDVLANADIACHIAKTGGGNQTHVYAPDSDYRAAMDMDLGWSTRLRDALDNDRFTLRFQPIIPIDKVDLSQLPDRQGALWERLSRNPEQNHACFEVLVRLVSASGEIIAPDAFIPTAERFHLMPEVDFWVLRHAFRELAAANRHWRRACFSLNLSGHTLGHPALIGLVQELLAEHEVDPSTVTFEVTETAAINNIWAAKHAINELKTMGCGFSLDDFGTGFSSFSHLKHLPVDYIKIDGMFVEGMALDPIDHAMVTSMNDIAHFLGRRTVAEYVADADILRLLAKCGVDFLQGYFISPPLEHWHSVSTVPAPVRLLSTVAEGNSLPSAG